MVKHLLTTYTGHAVELLKECQPIFIRLSEIVDEAGYNAAFLQRVSIALAMQSAVLAMIDSV